MQLGLYQHYSGKFYQVIGVCRHSESLEEMIVYRALYGDYALWVRPKDIFFSMILQDNQQVPRFKFIKALDILPAELR
jgi:hypothetical protein